LLEQLRREGEIFAHDDCCAFKSPHTLQQCHVRDELDYEYAIQAEKEKKTSARAKTKGIKALNLSIAQALLSRISDIDLAL
jgi:hypothetical protein